jgi:hypothetical protein
VQQVEIRFGYSGEAILRARFLSGEHTTAANVPQARSKSWNS